MEKNLEEDIWEWFEERFGKEAADKYRTYETEELVKEVKRRARCKKMKEIEKHLENLEKKIDWLVEYLCLGMSGKPINEIKITFTPSIGTEEKELIKYYKEPSTTDGQP